jgi:hypothetical protein
LEGLRLTLGDSEGDRDGLTLGLRDGLMLGEREGLRDTLGDVLGECEGDRDALRVGETDGLSDTLGEREGETDSLADGLEEIDGLTLGEAEGDRDALGETDDDGLTLGDLLGLIDGLVDAIALPVGHSYRDIGGIVDPNVEPDIEDRIEHHRAGIEDRCRECVLIDDRAGFGQAVVDRDRTSSRGRVSLPKRDAMHNARSTLDECIPNHAPEIVALLGGDDFAESTVPVVPEPTKQTLCLVRSQSPI